MKTSRAEALSLWQSEWGPASKLSALRHDISCDVCVVGAGICGLSTAYFLQKEGHSVVVADAHILGGGETANTTAHLTSAFDDGYYELEKFFNHEDLKLFASSHIKAIDMMESIARDEKIDCDFERIDGYLTAMKQDQREALRNEIGAYRRAGFSNLQSLSSIPLPQIQSGPTLLFPRQATFNITKYMRGLAEVIQNRGGRIYADTRIVDIQDGIRPRAETKDGYTIDAQSVIVATHTPLIDRFTMHVKQAVYRSYVMAFEVPSNSYPGFLFWDLEDPYHYARRARGDRNDFLLIGGEDHKGEHINNAEGRWKKIEEWSRDHFSMLGPVVSRWSGLIMEPADHIAFIGRNPGSENIFMITGDSGNGITHGTIGGMLITDLIQGRPNPLERIYDPSRKSAKSVLDYIKENSVLAGMKKYWTASGRNAA